MLIIKSAVENGYEDTTNYVLIIVFTGCITVNYAPHTKTPQEILTRQNFLLAVHCVGCATFPSASLFHLELLNREMTKC